MRKVSAVVMAAVAFSVAAVRGSELCLCDEGPGECGHACHEGDAPASDGVTDGGGCLHLDVSSVDPAPADTGVRLPVVWFAPVAVPYDVRPAVSEPGSLPRATGPPSGLPAFCRYSVRLMPRS